MSAAHIDPTSERRKIVAAERRSIQQFATPSWAHEWTTGPSPSQIATALRMANTTMNRTRGPPIFCRVDFMAFSTVPLTPTRNAGSLTALERNASQEP